MIKKKKKNGHQYLQNVGKCDQPATKVWIHDIGYYHRQNRQQNKIESTTWL